MFKRLAVFWDQNSGAGSGGTGDGQAQDIEYWKAEAKKAFEKRDAVAAQLRALEGRALSQADVEEYHRLKDKAHESEIERQKAAGQFEAALKTEREKSQKAMQDAADKAKALEAQIADDKIMAAFLASEALFGPTGETVLLPEVAAAYFRGQVKFEPVEVAGKQVSMVVVKDATGNTINGPNGNPAPFTDAMRQVIKSLPQDKQDRLLRGSGKVGSGGSGGSTVPIGAQDVAALVAKARAGDVEAIKALQKREAAMGGMVVGRAWDKA